MSRYEKRQLPLYPDPDTGTRGTIYQRSCGYWKIITSPLKNRTSEVSTRCSISKRPVRCKVIIYVEISPRCLGVATWSVEFEFRAGLSMSLHSVLLIRFQKRQALSLSLSIPLRPCLGPGVEAISVSRYAVKQQFSKVRTKVRRQGWERDPYKFKVREQCASRLGEARQGAGRSPNQNGIASHRV